MVLNVKEIAETRGFKNAKQLADVAGIRYKSMYPIWNGTARMVGLDTIEKLCVALRVQAGMLFEVIPDESSEIISDDSGKKSVSAKRSTKIKPIPR